MYLADSGATDHARFGSTVRQVSNLINLAVNTTSDTHKARPGDDARTTVASIPIVVTSKAIVSSVSPVAISPLRIDGICCDDGRTGDC